MGFRIDAQTIFEHRRRADRPHLSYSGREVTMSDATNLDYVIYRDPRMAEPLFEDDHRWWTSERQGTAPGG
jgi:hypothetical protein